MKKHRHRHNGPKPAAPAQKLALTMPIPPNTASHRTSGRKILIAIPCHSGSPSYETTVSCANASREAAAQGWETVLMLRATDSMLVRARDVLVSSFWFSDCSDMLFVDSDIAWDPGVFTKIMSHVADKDGKPVELVGGAYTGRGDPPNYILRTNERSIEVQYPSGLAEISGIGTGFMRITRAAVRRLIEANPNAWYTDHTAPALPKIYHFFDFVFREEDHLLYSEDYMFCERFRGLGGKVFVDVDLTLHHSGHKSWTGNFGAFLRAGGNADNPITTAPSAPAAAPVGGLTLVDAVKSMVEDAA
jgi:hypothetical protein